MGRSAGQIFAYGLMLLISPATLVVLWDSLKLSWHFALGVYCIILLTIVLFHLQKRASLKAWLLGATFLEVAMCLAFSLFYSWYTMPASAQTGAGAVYIVFASGVLLLGLPAFLVHNVLVWNLAIRVFINRDKL